MANGKVFFYEVRKTDAAVKEEGSGGANTAMVELRRELDEVKAKIGEIRGGMETMTSAMMGMRGVMETHTEKMTEALSLMMRMVTSVEQRTSLAQQMIFPRSSGEPRFPAPGNPITQQAPVNHTVTPSKKRKEIPAKPTTTVSVQRTTSRPAVKETEEPTPSVPKKVKTDRLKHVPQKSGSHGGQAHN